MPQATPPKAAHELQAQVAALQTELDYKNQLLDEYRSRKSHEERLLENIAVTLIATDPQFVITSWNKTAREIYGWKPWEVIDKSIDEVLKPEYQIPYEEVKREFIARGIWRGEVIHHCKDGAALHMLATMTLVKDEQGKPLSVIFVSQDIAASKSMEKSLQHSEERFSKVFSNSPLAMSVTRLSDGKFVDVNDRFVQLFEYEPSELVGHTPLDLGMVLHSTPRSGTAAEQTEIGTQSYSEMITRTKSGSLRWVLISNVEIDIDGETCVLGTLIDTTPQKLAEETLRASEQRFFHAFQDAPDAAYIFGMESLSYLDANQAFLKLTGHTRQDVIGKEITAIELWTDVGRGRQFEELFESNDEVHDFELAYRRGDGSTGYALTSATKVILNDEVCMLVQFTDITQRNKAELELRKYEEHLEELVNQRTAELQKEFAMRREAQEELRKSEERFRLSLKHAPVTVAAQDRNLRFLWAYNQRTVDPKSVVGLTDTDIFPPDSAARLMALKRKVLETETELEEQLWVTSGGRRVFLDLFLEPIRDMHGKVTGIGIATVDLTPEKIAEQAVMESEKRYRSLFDSMHEVFMLQEVVLDKNHQQCDLRILEVNQAAERFYGKTREELIGHIRSEVLGVPDHEVTEVFGGVALTGEPAHLERYSPEAGRWYESFSYSPQPGQVAVLALDITERKHAEESEREAMDALRQSEERFEAIASYTPDWESWVDPKGRLLWVNPAVEKTTGYTAAEVLAMKNYPFPMFLKEDHHLLRSKWVNTVEGSQAEDLEVRLRHKDGMLRWVSIASTPIYDRNGSSLGIRSSIRDIHEHIEAEEKVRHQAYLLENVSEAVISAGPDFMIRSWNKAAEDLYGKSAGEVIGKSMLEATQAVYLPGTREALLKDLFEQDHWKGELVHHHKDGTLLHVLSSVTLLRDEQGKPANILSANRDITERKQAEEALRASKERFSTVFHASPVAVSIVRLKDDIFMDVNEAWEKATGYPRAEVIGQTAVGINLWVETVRRDLLLKQMEQGTIDSFEFQMRQKSGGIREMLMSTEKIELEGEACMMTMAVDITERKQAEKALGESEARYRSLFENMAEGAFYRLPDGTLTDANQAALQFFGLSREEFVGKTIQDQLWHFIHEDGSDFLDDEYPAVAAFVSGKPVLETIAGVYNPQRNEMVWADMNANLLYKPGEDRPYSTFMTLHDITERKKAEEKVRFQAHLLAVVSEAILSTDADMRVESWNKGAEEMYGYTAEEAIGKNSNGLLRAERTQEANKAVLEKLYATNAWQGELLHHHKDGTPIHILSSVILERDDQGRPARIITANRDITERRQAEEKLRQAEERFLKAFQNSFAGLAISRASDGCFVDVNDSYAAILGYTPEEMVDHTSLELNLLGPAERQHILDELRKDGRLRNIELAMRAKNGAIVNTLYSIDLIELNGETHLVTSLYDITERKQAEESLAREHALLSSIMDTSPVGIIRVAADGQLMFANPQAEHIMGLARAEMTARQYNSPGWRITAPGGEPFPDEKLPFSIVKATGKPVYGIEHAIQWPDGRLVQLSINSAPIFEPSGAFDGMVASCEDITGRKQAEEKLRESEERFVKVFHMSPSAMAITRLSTGTIVDANEHFLEVFGYELQEVLDHSPVDLKMFPSPDERARFVQLTGEKNGLRDFEMMIPNKKGDPLNILLSNTTIELDGEPHIIATILDITERKRTEEKLHQAEERWQFALEGVGDGIWDWDIQTNKEFYSPKWKAMLGYEEREIGDTPEEWSRRIHPLERQSVLVESERHLEGKVPAFNAEYRMRCKDGSYKWILDRGKVIERDANGRPRRMIGVHSDISERKRVEEKLRQAEERFVKAFEGSPAAVSINRLNDAVYVDVNEGMCDLLGYTRQEMIGHSTLELKVFVDDEERQRLGERLRREGRLSNIEICLHTKTGAILHTLFAAVLIELDGEIHFMSSLIDISQRMQAEEKLRQSEERFTKSFQFNPAGMSIGRFSDGCYTDANQSALDILGYTREEVIGHNPIELKIYADPEDRTRLGKILLEGGVLSNRELKVRTKSGAIVDTLYSAHLYDLAGETYISTALVDITQRKQAENALQEAMSALQTSEKRYRRLFETIQESFVVQEVVLDENQEPVDLRFLEVNQAAERFIGKDRSELVGRTRIEVFGEIDAGDLADFAGVALGGAPIHLGGFSSTAGSWFEGYSYSPEPGLIATLLSDISERKQATDAMIASEQKFSLAFQQSPTGTCIISMERQVLIDANESFLDISGFNRSEVAGRPVEEVLNWTEAKQVERFQKTLEARRMVREFEIKFRRKDGSLGYALVNGVLMTLNGEECLMIEVLDISERRQVEEKLHQYQDHLEELVDQRTNELRQAAHALRVANSYNRSLIEASLDPLVTIGADGKITDANSAAEAVTFRGRDQLIGTDFSDYFTDPEKARAGYQQAFEQGSVRDYALELKQRKGHPLFVLYNASTYRDEEGKVIGVFASARDITGRVQAEKDLRASEIKYRTLFETFPLGVSISDKSGKLVESNKVAERILGLSQDEHNQRLIDSPEWRIIRPDGQLMPAEEYPSTQALNENRLVENVLMGIVRDPQDTAWISVTAAPIPLDDYGVAIAYSDVTAQKKAEEALQEVLHDLRVTHDQLNTIADHLPVLIAHVSTDERYLYVNDYYSRFYGKAKNEIVGQKVKDFLGKQRYALLAPQNKRVLKGEEITHEVDIVDALGKIHHHITQLIPQHGEDERVVGYFVLSRDVNS